MIIDNSTIELAASHQKSEVKQQQRSHHLFLQELQTLIMPSNRMSRLVQQPGQSNQTVNSTEQTRGMQAASMRSMNAYRAQFMGFSADHSGRFRLAAASPAQTGDIAATTVNPLLQGAANSSIRLFQALFDALAEHSHDVAPVVTPPATESIDAESSQSTVPEVRLRDGSALSRPMIEVNVQVTEYYKETECSTFSACGQVQTRDGETIDFDLNLQMSRSFESTREYQRTEMMEFKDPLVVNFDGSAAELSEQKYQFDLDADGELDWISFVSEQGALLALDRNEDGVINDGTELFGALSGNGFSDLSQYDDDGNGFIDEADAIFGDLRLWTKTAGEDRLDTLLDRDVGAIYLGSTETPFELKDEANQQHGRVRHSGVYLQQDGAVGTVQQIDMVV